MILFVKIFLQRNASIPEHSQLFVGETAGNNVIVSQDLIVIVNHLNNRILYESADLQVKYLILASKINNEKK